ncbi:hypothetical protein Tco_0749659 [Tanacetum coccineum]|uniref:Uncharacterized protein n=1 Tax=Tanacetum coccineum TaxID=301880 RepID=A0ABQ4Z238_9ASTR
MNNGKLTTKLLATNLPKLCSLFGFDYRLKALEDNFSELRQNPINMAEAISSILAPLIIIERIKARKQWKMTTHLIAVAANLSEFELKKILIVKMKLTTPINRSITIIRPCDGADDDPMKISLETGTGVVWRDYKHLDGLLYEDDDVLLQVQRRRLHRQGSKTLRDAASSRARISDNISALKKRNKKGEVLAKTFWSQRAQSKREAMIQAIDKRIKTRGIRGVWRDLSGGRPYGGSIPTDPKCNIGESLSRLNSCRSKHTLPVQIWDVPGPEGMHGNNSTYTTEGYGYGIVFKKGGKVNVPQHEH